MATQTERAVLVRASGAVPWRVHRGELQVALVHRPRYDDWSWAKGKLERGEEWAVAAGRETLEETGLLVRLGPPLPTSWYGLGTKDGRPQLKQVRYWAGTVRGGAGALEHEVDEVAWLGVGQARDRLTYRRDREQLDAVQEAHDAGLLATWNLLVVRHAVAQGRGSWKGPDPQRPLTDVGRRRAARIVPLLKAYAPTRLVTSPSIRCADTLQPFAEQEGVPLTTRAGLSEEGYAAAPAKALKHLRRALERGEDTAVCTHGPVLPDLLTELAGHALAGQALRMLTRLAKGGLDKGEVLAVQLAGTGSKARVVHVERHRPPPP